MVFPNLVVAWDMAFIRLRSVIFFQSTLQFGGRDLVIGCYKYTNIPNSTWGVAIGKKRAETTILRHSMPK